MRCIEIKDFLSQATVLLRLTLTWDVLKSGWLWTSDWQDNRLTLTWDVLKW